ncbi:ComEC/Rec2 family competence protein [Flavobacterium luteolum]|uniref:ComEC/Rec2 family competence protein n=1 Tax=Flavobacterium luteolum TaxID=3003259 RepID=UPI00248DE362|nr:MBL fold metallo-hydrolase [Flavobacterium luteolum]
MQIKFFQAECGDAAAIRFLGNDNKYHNVLIDSGYERTFRHVLDDEIQSIASRDEVIDLWIITHIHDDHIGGVIKYIETVRDGENKDIVEQYLYNAPRIYDFEKSSKIISEFVSLSQGDALYEYLSSNKKLLDYDVTNAMESVELFGLRLTILSPTSNMLSRLRSKYGFDNYKQLERQESEEISEAVSAKQNDYTTLIGDFDLNKWKEDNSIENGSSISVLTEFNSTKVLWLADSHPSEIERSLRTLGYSQNNKIECAWVKVTHHGSKGNNSDDLYDLIDCSNFLFSVDGVNRHNLPSKECIARILRNKQRPENSKYNFYFTYDNPVLRSIFDRENDTIYEQYNFQVYYADQKFVAIDL